MEIHQYKMDEEGKQTMRVLARNMVFLMKSIALGKEKFGLPEVEERVATHFIRQSINLSFQAEYIRGEEWKINNLYKE